MQYLSFMCKWHLDFIPVASVCNSYCNRQTGLPLPQGVSTQGLYERSNPTHTGRPRRYTAWAHHGTSQRSILLRFEILQPTDSCVDQKALSPRDFFPARSPRRLIVSIHFGRRVGWCREIGLILVRQVWIFAPETGLIFVEATRTFRRPDSSCFSDTVLCIVISWWSGLVTNITALGDQSPACSILGSTTIVHGARALNSGTHTNTQDTQDTRTACSGCERQMYYFLYLNLSKVARSPACLDLQYSQWKSLLRFELLCRSDERFDCCTRLNGATGWSRD